MLNVNLGVNFMNLHTPFSLECCPLVDFANDIKEKRKKEGTISSNLFICATIFFQIHSQLAEIYQKNISTYHYLGALGVYSFTITNLGLLCRLRRE